MGSLPDSKYIIKTDGYWFVEAHDVDSSKGYITVSAKGIANGLSNEPNDGADFGPDSYNPNYSGSGIPYTTSMGLREALEYATSNAVLNVYGTYEAITVKLLQGDHIITEAFTVNPSKIIHSLTITGSGFDNTRLVAQLNGSYAITLSTQFNGGVHTIRDMGWYFPSGYTPSGMFDYDAQSSATAFNLVNIENGSDPSTYISRFANLQFIYATNIQSESTHALYLSATDSIQYYNGFGSANCAVEVSGGGSHVIYGAGNITESGNPSVVILDNVATVTLNGNVQSSIVIIRGVGNTININANVGHLDINGRSLYQTALLTNSTGTTYTISYLTARNIVNISGGTLTSGNITVTYADFKLSDILPDFNITTSTPSVPASGTAQQNTNPYPVNVYLYGGTVTVIDYTPAGGSATQVGTSGPATVRLNPGDSITLTYSAAPTWNWVAV